jgi:hypothetical protein
MELIGVNDRYKTTPYSKFDLNRSFKSNNITGLGKKLKSFVSLNKNIASRGSAIANLATFVMENGLTTLTDTGSFYWNTD